MRTEFVRSAMGLVVAATLGLAACDRSAVEPPGHERLGTVAITDRSASPQVVLATWTHTGGWDRTSLGTFSHAAEPDRTRKVLGVRMWTRGGDEIQLVEGGEYEARYFVDADPQTVVDMDPSRELFHGDHVYVFGYHQEGRTGTAQIGFSLWHDGHSDDDTDAIGLVITD